MKKVLSLLLVVALTFPFVGCGKEEKVSDAVEAEKQTNTAEETVEETEKENKEETPKVSGKERRQAPAGLSEKENIAFAYVEGIRCGDMTTEEAKSFFYFGEKAWINDEKIVELVQNSYFAEKIKDLSDTYTVKDERGDGEYVSVLENGNRVAELSFDREHENKLYDSDVVSPTVHFLAPKGSTLYIDGKEVPKSFLVTTEHSSETKFLLEKYPVADLYEFSEVLSYKMEWKIETASFGEASLAATSTGTEIHHANYDFEFSKYSAADKEKTYPRIAEMWNKLFQDVLKGKSPEELKLHFAPYITVEEIKPIAEKMKELDPAKIMLESLPPDGSVKSNHVRRTDSIYVSVKMHCNQKEPFDCPQMTYSCELWKNPDKEEWKFGLIGGDPETDQDFFAH